MESKGKVALLAEVRAISDMVNIHYIRQKEPKGLGHAIHCAKSFIGYEPFAVLLGDDIVDAEKPCLLQMMEVYEQYETSILGVQQVDRAHVDKYGIVDGVHVADRLYRVNGLVEKPSVDAAPSNIAVLDRYIINPGIFEILEDVLPGKGGEIQLTDALQVLAQSEAMYAYHFAGRRYDVGDKQGFLEATVEFALKREELRGDFLAYLMKLVTQIKRMFGGDWMLNDTAESTSAWYTLIVKEHEERYLGLVEPYQPDKLNVLIDLRNDYAFKQLFGSIGNERILIEFLNVVLKLPIEKQIQKVTLMNTEVLKEYAKDKKSMLDILVKTNDGNYINVEIQLCNKYDMPVRSLYYGARLISKEVQESEAYIKLKQTITINIVNFNQFNTTDAFHTRFELYDLESKVTLTDRLQKFLDQWKRGQLHPREDRLARWLLLLEASEDGTILTELEAIAMQQDPVLAEALDRWDEMSRDPDVRMAYEMRYKQLKDEAVGMKDVELRGEAGGEVRGKTELIRTMLQKGLTVSQIAEWTGLTVEEINLIKL